MHVQWTVDFSNFNRTVKRLTERWSKTLTVTLIRNEKTSLKSGRWTTWIKAKRWKHSGKVTSNIWYRRSRKFTLLCLLILWRRPTKGSWGWRRGGGVGGGWGGRPREGAVKLRRHEDILLTLPPTLGKKGTATVTHRFPATCLFA